MGNDLTQLPWRPGQLTIVENYWEATGILAALRAGIAPGAVRRPFAKLEPRTWREAGSAPCTAAVSNIRGEP